MRPEISILMPVRNAGKWLEETLKSILQQSFISWELIAVDDASTDNSLEQLYKVAELDPRIKVLKNEAVGIIPALQIGLQHARGRFITRMDADDLMPPERLLRMYNSVSLRNPKTVVTGKIKYISEKSISDGYLRYEKWLNDLVDQQNFYDHIYRECVVASPNWMCQRVDLVEANIFSELNYPEDYHMVLQWHQKGFAIHGINDVTLYWREHPMRTSRNSNSYAQRSFFHLKIDHFIKNELRNKEQLSILGVGTKSKLIVKQLKESNITFHWYDLNHQQYNSPIMGICIQNYENLCSDKLLIAVFPEKQEELLSFIQSKGFKIGENAWYV